MPEKTESLADMRKSCNLTLVEVGQLLGIALGRPPYTHPRIHQIETEGIKDDDQVEALASIYNRPVEAVRAAAKSLRK